MIICKECGKELGTTCEELNKTAFRCAYCDRSLCNKHADGNFAVCKSCRKNKCSYVKCNCNFKEKNIFKKFWIKFRIFLLRIDLGDLDASLALQEIILCEYTREKEIIENKIEILKEKLKC